jgi:G:T-mismatch repair DNA endonuclease (very short patch repair protein)
MIKEKNIIINGHSSNYKYYRELGYDVNIRKPFLVKTEDLMRGSSVLITSICDICLLEYSNTFKDYYIYTNGFKNYYYCNKCKVKKSEKTCIERYGVKNPMQCDFVKEILRNTILDRYGVNHYSKTDEYKIKFKSTISNRYGVDNPFKSDKIKENIKSTNNIKYGVDYPQQNIEIKLKSEETCLNKYGDSIYTKTDTYKEKVKNSNVIKYGVENVSQLDTIKYKKKSTSIKNYGVDHISKTEDFKNSIKEGRERNTNKKYSDLLKNEYEVLSYKNDIFEIIHNKCGLRININKGLVVARQRTGSVICNNCNPIGVQYSGIELEICDFLDNNNIEYIKGDRKILNGQELDIFIPKHNLAIEVNGLYWHSELFKNNTYHLNKTIKCIKKGIKLLHIWEDDLKYKNDIVKSIVLNNLKLNTNKIFARKCSVKLVSSKDAKLFLNANHIQGFSSSSIKLGLYNKDILVSLMTFGYRYTNGKREYELIRFCNIINYNIVGSASKLFSYFTKNYEVDEVISYADISLFNGLLYKLLGFEKVSLSKPNYFWIVDNIRRHRFNFNKKKLVEQGFDVNKTELEIMNERGYYRIFSCGQEKWIYINLDKKKHNI